MRRRLPDAECGRKRSFLAKFRTGSFVHVGPGDEETWEFHKRAHLPNCMWNEMGQKFFSVCEKHDFLVFMEVIFSAKTYCEIKVPTCSCASCSTPKTVLEDLPNSSKDLSITCGLTFHLRGERVKFYFHVLRIFCGRSVMYSPAEGQLKLEETKEDMVVIPAQGHFLQPTEADEVR